MAKEECMDLREAFEKYKQSKIPSLSEIREKGSQHSKTSLFIVIILVALLLLAMQFIPHLQVAQFNITNPKDLADAENSYRATLAQIFGGVAIGIGLYYTWRRINIAEEDLKVTQKNLEVAQDNLKVTQENLEATQKVAQENLKVAQEGQITERFTRAVDQLGNNKLEIRLGGIYALERIANESEKDYWPIIEILTAYVRKNSSSEDMILGEQNKISLDIQAVLTVISRRKNRFNDGESIPLNLQGTCLQNAEINSDHLEKANFKNANLNMANLAGSNLDGVNLARSNLYRTNLEGTNLNMANLEGSNLNEANLNKAYIENANLMEASLKKAYINEAYFRCSNLFGAHLEGANLYKTHVEGALLFDACFEGARLIEAHLEGARLQKARLQRAILLDAHLEGADLEMTNLSGAYLKGANLTGAKNLTIEQLSKVETLYNAKLDEELEKPLREKYPALFEEPKR